jgi:hypothetical protein
MMSPASASGERHNASQEHEFSVEPDPIVGDYMAPIILNIGQYYKKVQAYKSEMRYIPNLNITISVRMQHCQLHHIQKFADLVEKYMSEPRRLDMKDKKMQEVAKYNKELAETDPNVPLDNDSGSEVELSRKPKKALKLLGAGAEHFVNSHQAR